MKKLQLVIPFLFFVLFSCNEETSPVPHFELEINVNDDIVDVKYVLSDSGLKIIQYAPPIMSTVYDPQLFFKVYPKDTLAMIAGMDIKSHDCREQHALDVSSVTFTNDSGSVVVDPNVNHPKELDYAIRMINAAVPPEYRLYFIDMQSAIEPSDKQEL